MMATVDRIYELLTSKKNGTLSDTDRAELDAWANQSPANKRFAEKGISSECVSWQLDALLGTVVEDRLESILNELGTESPKFQIQDTSFRPNSSIDQ